MMNNLVIFIVIIVFNSVAATQAQTGITWPFGKKALIVLTYDDALPSQLKYALPQLDNAGLKATFFLIEPATEQDIPKWASAIKSGHELGNHTVYHPCLSSRIKTDPRYHSENYSVHTILREIRSMNKFLFAMDHKLSHSYAFPCDEFSINGKSYVDSLRNCGFIPYARRGGFDMVTNFKNLDRFQVPSLGFNPNPTGADLIKIVQSVLHSNAMGIFIFHGVGGDFLTVSAEAHQQLIQFLKDNNKDIWITTFKEAMEYVTKNAEK